MSKFNGAICVGVSNIAAAAAWYKEKFGLRESGQEVADGEPGDIELVSANGEITVDLVGLGEDPMDTPMFDTGNAEKAREWLLSRGVSVGPVQTDGQGTRYIEMRDLDNNMIEICEEP
jgi:catechol 2,3-dioxygenase-like lactoylglutathione lyase family enzyme